MWVNPVCTGGSRGGAREARLPPCFWDRPPPPPHLEVWMRHWYEHMTLSLSLSSLYCPYFLLLFPSPSFASLPLLFQRQSFHRVFFLFISLSITLGTRGFSRVRREFSVLAEAARVTIKTWRKPETALEKSLAPRVTLNIIQYNLRTVEACVAEQSTPRTLVGGSSLASRVVSLDKEVYSTLSLFTQVYKWISATYCLGVTVWWASMPSRGSSNTPRLASCDGNRK